MMKSSTSKLLSAAPIPEEPSAEYVNNNLPDPDDEPLVSDMRNYEAGEELLRQESELAKKRYARALPEMISANRGKAAELFTRFTEEEKRRKAEMQKNKEAMAIPLSRHSGDNRKRRNDVMAQSAEEEWKRQPHQQQWMAQSQMQHGFQMQQYQQQQYMQMQMAAQQQQHHKIQMHHNNQMPSTSTADSARSVHTPAAIHQQSPMEGCNGNRMTPSRSGMNTSSPTTGLDQQTDENTSEVPEGDWFENLAVTPADGMVNGVAQQLPPPIQQLPTKQPQQHEMRMMQQQQQNHEEMRRMEQQRHQQLLQQAQLAQLSQQRRQQQQMIFQQQHQMNGGFQSHAQQQAAYMQAQRMHQMRMQQHQQQQQLHHHQQQQQHHQNGGMGYGMPNGYPNK